VRVRDDGPEIAVRPPRCWAPADCVARYSRAESARRPRQETVVVLACIPAWRHAASHGAGRGADATTRVHKWRDAAVWRYRPAMPLSADALHDHLVALRWSLAGTPSYSRIEAPVLAVFRELLVRIQAAVPQNEVLRAVEPPKTGVHRDTLLFLVDQMLVALDTLRNPLPQIPTSSSDPVGRSGTRYAR